MKQLNLTLAVLLMGAPAYAGGLGQNDPLGSEYRSQVAAEWQQVYEERASLAHSSPSATVSNTVRDYVPSQTSSGSTNFVSPRLGGSSGSAGISFAENGNTDDTPDFSGSASGAGISFAGTGDTGTDAPDFGGSASGGGIYSAFGG